MQRLIGIGKKDAKEKIYSQNFEQYSSQDCENVSHLQSYLINHFM